MSPAVIRFRYQVEKFISAVTYFAQHGVPELTRLKVAKLVYFADKYHLVEYGRPILGDTYFALPLGPIPTVSLDIMEAACAGEFEGGPDSNVEAFLGALEVCPGQHPTFMAKEPVDFSDLSESETEVLDKVIERYGGDSVSDLIEITHSEKSWIETRNNGPIDFRLMFDSSDEENNKLRIKLLEEDQEDREFFEFSR